VINAVGLFINYFPKDLRNRLNSERDMENNAHETPFRFSAAFPPLK
jgi:hypothetical protein